MADSINATKIHNSYLDKLDQAKRAHESELENVKKTGKHVQESQRESYDKQLGKTEESYKTQFNRMTDSQKAELAKKNENYNDALKVEKDAFHELAKKNQDDFRYRLDKINHDYTKLRDAEKSQLLDKNESDRNRYKSTIGEIQQDYNTKAKSYESQTVGAQGEVRQKYLDDKHNLVKDYENKIGDMTQQHSKTNNLLKDKITHDLEEMRRAQNQDLHTTRENARGNFERLKHAYADSSRQQEEEHQDVKREIGKALMENNQVKNRDFEKAFATQNELHRRSEGKLRNELQGMGTRSIDFNKALSTTNQMQTDSINDSKFKQYQDERELLSKKFDGTVEHMEDKYKSDLAFKGQTFKNKVEEVKNNDAVSRLEERIGHQNKYDIMTSKFNEKYQNDKADFERNQSDQSSDYSTKLNNIRSSYETQLKDMRRKNEYHMKDYKQNVHFDKKRYYDKMESAMKDEIRRKDKNSDLHFRTMNDAHDRVNRELRRENARLDINIKDQKDNLRDDFEEVLSFERSHAEMQREADFDAYKRLSIKKQTELHTQIKDLHETYQDKLEKSKYASDKKIAKLERDMENLTTRLTKKAERDMKKVKADDNAELFRVKLALETEKEAMVQKYEEQIREIKRTYQAQMDRLSEFHMNQIDDVQQT